MAAGSRCGLRGSAVESLELAGSQWLMWLIALVLCICSSLRLSVSGLSMQCLCLELAVALAADEMDASSMLLFFFSTLEEDHVLRDMFKNPTFLTLLSLEPAAAGNMPS